MIFGEGCCCGGIECKDCFLGVDSSATQVTGPCCMNLGGNLSLRMPRPAFSNSDHAIVCGELTGPCFHYFNNRSPAQAEMKVKYTKYNSFFAATPNRRLWPPKCHSISGSDEAIDCDHTTDALWGCCVYQTAAGCLSCSDNDECSDYTYSWQGTQAAFWDCNVIGTTENAYYHFSGDENSQQRIPTCDSEQQHLTNAYSYLYELATKYPNYYEGGGGNTVNNIWHDGLSGNWNKLQDSLLAYIHLENWWQFDSGTPADPRPSGACGGGVHDPGDVLEEDGTWGYDSAGSWQWLCRVPKYFIFACSGAPLFYWDLIDARNKGFITDSEVEEVIAAIGGANGNGTAEFDPSVDCDPLPQAVMMKLWNSGHIKTTTYPNADPPEAIVRKNVNGCPPSNPNCGAPRIPQEPYGPGYWNDFFFQARPGGWTWVCADPPGTGPEWESLIPQVPKLCTDGGSACGALLHATAGGGVCGSDTVCMTAAPIPNCIACYPTPPAYVPAEACGASGVPAQPVAILNPCDGSDNCESLGLPGNAGCCGTPAVYGHCSAGEDGIDYDPNNPESYCVYNTATGQCDGMIFQYDSYQFESGDADPATPLSTTGRTTKCAQSVTAILTRCKDDCDWDATAVNDVNGIGDCVGITSESIFADGDVTLHGPRYHLHHDTACDISCYAKEKGVPVSTYLCDGAIAYSGPGSGCGDCGCATYMCIQCGITGQNRGSTTTFNQGHIEGDCAS